MENLKCPCCNQEPEATPHVTYIHCANEKCALYLVIIPGDQWNNPALRIVEQEAEKKGWNEAVKACQQKAVNIKYFGNYPFYLKHRISDEIQSLLK